MRIELSWPNRIVIAIVASIALGATGVDAQTICRGQRWVGVWAASPSYEGAAFADQTLRLVVNPTYRGSRVRVRLSNRFGASPAIFGAVTIARRLVDAEVVPRSTRVVRFAGQTSVVIPPGGEVVSDQTRFKVREFQDVVVSAHVAGSGPATEHTSALQTSYVSAPGGGDRTADETGVAFTQSISGWPFLTDLEVRASQRVAGVVAIGDSITAGYPVPVDSNLRYPDLLARRLAALRRPRIAVQNAGIGGNRVLRDGTPIAFGPALLDRLDADAIDQAGASIVLLMEGTNDLGLQPAATADEVILGLYNAVTRLHLAGFRVLLGTQAPCNDPALAYGTAAAVAARNEINAWIRITGVADGVVDFHAALRDPADPDRLRPEFDSGDHLHPGPAGYQAMADAVDLNLLADAPCRSSEP
jgi:lysophospholipase L1-like esterase